MVWREVRMRPSRFSAEQIIRIVGEHDSGVGIDEVCRRHGISRATLYRWKQQYSGMAVSELQRLQALEAEHARLKRLVADKELHNQMFKDLLGQRS
jgi:putative transposase